MSAEQPVKLVHRTWGKQVRHARKSKGLTQVDLARLIGLEQNTVSRFETGASAPTDATKIQLALVLERNLDELFAWPEGVLDVARYRQGSAA